MEWETTMKPGKRRQLDKSGPKEAAEKRKASVRAKVENPFLLPEWRINAPALRVREGALPWPGEEHAADRASAGLLESADRGPLRDGLNAGPLRPLSAERRESGRKTGNPALRSPILKQKETLSPAWSVSDCRLPAVSPRPGSEPGFNRASLDMAKGRDGVDHMAIMAILALPSHGGGSRKHNAQDPTGQVAMRDLTDAPGIWTESGMLIVLMCGYAFCFFPRFLTASSGGV